MEWIAYIEIIGVAMPFSTYHNVPAWNGWVKSAISPSSLIPDYLD